jgi:uncharacterized protein (DUF849 family)
MIQIALNGARPKSENKFLPHSLDEIVKEVSSVYGMGFDVFHIHCYDKNGQESLDPGDVKNLVQSIKKISPGIQIGISSGDWIEPDYEKRIHLIKNWTILPDFISVNMIEEHSSEISRLLISKGIYVEVGLNETKAAELFVENKIIHGCIRILIEPEDTELPLAIKTVNEIEGVLEYGKIGIKKLLHGYNTTAWDLFHESLKRGYDCRIGMEDTIYLTDGREVKSNYELAVEADIQKNKI